MHYTKKKKTWLPIISPAPIRIPVNPCKLLANVPKDCVCPTQVPYTPLKNVSSKPENKNRQLQHILKNYTTYPVIIHMCKNY